jgi:hypothetical protein
MKIIRKCFRPKRSFVKSVPGSRIDGAEFVVLNAGDVDRAFDRIVRLIREREVAASGRLADDGPLTQPAKPGGEAPVREGLLGSI